MATKKPKRKAKGDIEIGPVFKKELPVTIDAKAAQKKDTEIRKLLTERVQLKEDIKPTQQKIGNTTKRIEKLRAEVESMTELHEVKCREEFDYPHRVVRTRRMDTGRIVPELERTMEASDRQEDLLEKRKTKKAKPEKVPAAHAKDEDAAESIEAGEKAVDDALPAKSDGASEASVWD